MAFIPRGVLSPPAYPGGPLEVENAAAALDGISIESFDADGQLLAGAGLTDSEFAKALSNAPPEGSFATAAEVLEAAERCGRELAPSRAGDWQAEQSACVESQLGSN